jgi:hypothetical protein
VQFKPTLVTTMHERDIRVYTPDVLYYRGYKRLESFVQRCLPRHNYCIQIDYRLKYPATCWVKTSKLRLVAINQQYCNGRKTRGRKVRMTAALRRRAKQNIGDAGGGAPTSIFRRRRPGKIFSGATGLDLYEGCDVAIYCS